jgi:hypothetical protein
MRCANGPFRNASFDINRIAGCAGVGLLIAGFAVAHADPRWIEGTYRNHAFGYSIEIPRGLKGLVGDKDGPERGPRIQLHSGGNIVVFGEPNSLEWKTPEEGIRYDLSHEKCESGAEEVSKTRLGKLEGASGSFICKDRVVHVLLVFRPRGEPIYWLRLETTRAHEKEDEAVLANTAASFKLIRWN